MPARRRQCGGRWRHGAGEELSRCERIFGNGFTQSNTVLGRPPDGPGTLPTPAHGLAGRGCHCGGRPIALPESAVFTHCSKRVAHHRT
eukprot:SM000051S17635  [mRNA]  locus=s51:751456:751850:- [translate_table: standard]